MPNPEVWPGWETVRVIGQGSYGAVYEVRRDVFGTSESAAVKQISIPQNDSDIEELRADGYDEQSVIDTYGEKLRRITDEYSLMRKLNGTSNVVSCDDFRCVSHPDGIGWDIYIKMELLRPLSSALPGVISEAEVLKIARDLCSALVLCERHNIVHRDIKPQNIFVSPNGDYKLGDFGIARTMENIAGGTRVGTVRYISPEVYNNHPYGAQADIYSLGLVLYWLMNERRLPFLPLPPMQPTSVESENAALRRLGGAPLPPPAHGSPELISIVMKACAFDPGWRYQTASDMLADLRSLSARLVRPGAQRSVNGYPAGVPSPAEGYGTAAAGTATARTTTARTEVPRTQTARTGMTQPARSGAAPKKKQNRLLAVMISVGASAILIGVVCTGLLIGRNAQAKQTAEAAVQDVTPEPEETAVQDVTPEPEETAAEPTAAPAEEKENSGAAASQVGKNAVSAMNSRDDAVFAGETLTFGRYNGEDITWRVLAESDNAVLVISEKCLDMMPYDDTGEGAAWADSTLRTWLNEDFYNTAFTASEQEQIMISLVRPDAESEEDARTDTKDKVFLLDIEEAEKYFSGDGDRRCSLGADECRWWLMTPGDDGGYESVVNVDGSLSSRGCDSGENGGVRPAMWIVLS